jgi:hypothetical protein
MLKRAGGFTFPKKARNCLPFLPARAGRGLRFGRRIWEGQANIGRNRQLLVVICKKWHVAKRLVVRIGGETDVEAVLYLFHEHNAGCPNLGGIENRVPKRG